MSRQLPPPVHRGPPRARATAGDTLFALGVAAFALVAAGLLVAATGGASWLAPFLPGTVAPVATPTPPVAGPIMAPSARPTASPSSRASPSPQPVATPAPTARPTATPAPTARPTATPGPFQMNLYRKGVFVHQVDKDACVAAAVQNTLNVIRAVEDGGKPDVSARTQRALYARIEKLTMWKDSHNGGTGPEGWAAVLAEEGYPYQVRVYDTRNESMRAAATALRATGRPVGILAWGGVHSWVMTGFRASADPALTRSFKVLTAFVIDPWYPWVSDRWPRSEPPNAPRDARDLTANVRPWKLASGPYPGRDKKFLLVVPLGG